MISAAFLRINAAVRSRRDALRARDSRLAVAPQLDCKLTDGHSRDQCPVCSTYATESERSTNTQPVSKPEVTFVLASSCNKIAREMNGVETPSYRKCPGPCGAQRLLHAHDESIHMWRPRGRTGSYISNWIERPGPRRQSYRHGESGILISPRDNDNLREVDRQERAEIDLLRCLSLRARCVTYTPRPSDL